MNINRGTIFLLLAALSFSVMSIIVRFLAETLEPFTQTFYRMVISTLLTFLWVLINRQSLVLTHIKRDWFPIAVMGIVGWGLSIMAFTLALEVLPVANVLFILSSYPLWASLFGLFILKEKITNRTLIALLILICALVIMFDPSNISLTGVGSMLALFAGITFGLYVVLSRLLTSRGNSPGTVTLWSVALGTLTAGVATLIFEEPQTAISLAVVAGVIVFGLLNFMANIFTNYGFKTVSASRGTMILMLEPVFATTIAFLILGESVTAFFLVGAALLLIAVKISSSSSS